MTVLRSLVVLSAFVVLCACGRGDAPSGAQDGAEGRKGEPAAASVTPAEGEARPTASWPELARATTASTVPGKGAEHLGLKAEALVGLFALEGRASTPSWSAAGTAPEASRDDDLDTAWTCTPAGGTPCALGLALAEPAKVTAVRIYGAGGFAWSEYTGHPRVTRVRVHTEAGFVEANVKDGADFGYVIFDAPIATRTITVEVIGTAKGKKDELVHIAELEVYGREGPRRAPLDLDPGRVFARYETTAFGTGDKHGVRQVFLAEARPEGAPKRLLRATALLGRKGDRLLLVERLFGTDCTRANGAYALLDQETRVLVPLIGFGDPPLPVLRHPEGIGFASIALDDPTYWRAAVLEEGRVVVRRPSAARARVVELGFTEGSPLPRGGTPLSGPLPSACTRGADDAAALAAANIDALVPGFDIDSSAVCELDSGAKAVIGLAAECGQAFGIVVLDAALARAHVLQGPKREADGPARGLWLAWVDGFGLVIEVSERGGDRGRIVHVHANGIEEVAAGASFAARSPAACDPCRDAFSPEVALERHAGNEVEAVRPPGSDETRLEGEVPEPAGDEEPQPDDAPEDGEDEGD